MAGAGSGDNGGVWAPRSALLGPEVTRQEMTFVLCATVWWALRPCEAEEEERAVSRIFRTLLFLT